MNTATVGEAPRVRPARSVVCPEAIPAALKTRFQWVVWRYEQRDEKWTKVPFDARTHRPAKSTDPNTWSAWEEALEAFNDPRRAYDGVGYVFAAADPFCGIDLDGAIDEDNKIAPWADAILDQVESYTEVTPSGRGLHIICRAKLPEGRRRKGGVEVYDAGRYFTVTGAHLPGTPATIDGAQAGVEALQASLGAAPIASSNGNGRAYQSPATDDELVRLMFAASNGESIKALWHGASTHASGSEADLALCNHLAFWTGGDAAQIDRLFRSSSLMRDKWDAKHAASGATYGEMTIAAALAGRTEFYRPPAPREAAEVEATPEGEEAPDPNTPAAPISVPPLPDTAAAILRKRAEWTGKWLKDYVAFASAAAPMTPPSFHEAAALFAASCAVARRLRLVASMTKVYPNLFLLFIAPSTLYSKTTGFQLLTNLFDRAGMRHFLLPQRMTPEAMVQEMSLLVPPGYAQADSETRADWLKERAFAASRGLALDEAQSLFDGLKRDYNNGQMALLLKAYDNPDVMTEQTVGRWRVTVRDVYLPFFGATTPASISTHITNDEMWQNGLWPRFALILPDEAPRYEFFPRAADWPEEIVRGLQKIDRLFPAPHATLVEREEPDGQKRRVVEVDDREEPASVLLSEGVWEAWDAYTRATRYDMLLAGEVEPALHSAYGRLSGHAIKVAMLLAAMDSEQLPVRVTLPHMAHAIEIVEGWRASLHRLRGAAVANIEETERERVLAVVTDAPSGILVRDICRATKLKAKEVREHLGELESAGQVQQYKVTAANGRAVDMARRV